MREGLHSQRWLWAAEAAHDEWSGSANARNAELAVLAALQELHVRAQRLLPLVVLVELPDDSPLRSATEMGHALPGVRLGTPRRCDPRGSSEPTDTWAVVWSRGSIVTADTTPKGDGLRGSAHANHAACSATA